MLGKRKSWPNRIIDVLAVGQKLKWVCCVTCNNTVILDDFCGFYLFCLSSDLLQTSEDSLRKHLNHSCEAGHQTVLRISLAKTNSMVNGIQVIAKPIKLEGCYFKNGPDAWTSVISVTCANTEAKMIIIHFTKTRTKTLEFDKTKIIYKNKNDNV